MAQPVSLPAAFDGMAQDFPRNNLPKGRAWNLVDIIPQALGAPGTERGGWGYASPALTTADASATYVKAGLSAPFTAGAQLLVLDDNSHLIKVVSSVSATDMGACPAPLQNPVMHQQIVVIPSADGTTLPKQYNGTAVSSLASGPACRYAAVFVNRAVMASSVAQPQRIYFSSPGDPTAWSLTGTSASYLDVGFPVKGLAALPNVLLAFGDDDVGRTARIRGTTPPPGTDMQVDDPVFNYGVSDARSIAVNGSVACFANKQGVFLTNGTAFPEDLTASVGLKRYWRDLLSTYAVSTWTIAGGWYGNIYIVSVMNGTTLIDTLAFDIQRRAGWRISNLKALCFMAAGQAGQELYAGQRSAPRVLQLSSMWSPSASVKNDADGTAVLGSWESPFYDSQKFGSQRWRDVYLEHDLRDAATDDPTWTLAYCTSPEAGASYTTVTPAIGETPAKTTARRPVHRAASGLGFKLTRTNASSVARLYGVAATVYTREGSRLN